MGMDGWRWWESDERDKHIWKLTDISELPLWEKTLSASQRVPLANHTWLCCSAEQSETKWISDSLLPTILSLWATTEVSQSHNTIKLYATLSTFSFSYAQDKHSFAARFQSVSLQLWLFSTWFYPRLLTWHSVSVIYLDLWHWVRPQNCPKECFPSWWLSGGRGRRRGPRWCPGLWRVQWL